MLCGGSITYLFGCLRVRMLKKRRRNPLKSNVIATAARLNTNEEPVYSVELDGTWNVRRCPQRCSSSKSCTIELGDSLH